jgi:hypothetical protein
MRTAIGWAFLSAPFVVVFGLFIWVMIWPPKSWADRTPAARARQRAKAAAERTKPQDDPSKKD